MNKKATPWIIVGLSCGFVMAGFVAFLVFVFFAVIGSMRSSQPYQDSLRAARADARVIAILGTPIERGLFMTGSINVQNRNGNADLTYPISGPKGAGSMHVVGTKTNGVWSYSAMTFTPKNGSPIELRVPPSTTTPGG